MNAEIAARLQASADVEIGGVLGRRERDTLANTVADRVVLTLVTAAENDVISDPEKRRRLLQRLAGVGLGHPMADEAVAADAPRGRPRGGAHQARRGRRGTG